MFHIQNLLTDCAIDGGLLLKISRSRVKLYSAFDQYKISLFYQAVNMQQ